MANLVPITSAQREQIAACLHGIEQARVELAKLHPDRQCAEL
jgi:hypothetical protein